MSVKRIFPPESADKPITDDAVLKVAKEVVLKFIEVGRLSPNAFDETFRSVFRSVMDTVRSTKP